MSMDAAALSAAVKEMQEANAAGKADDVIRLLQTLKTDVIATEDLLRVSLRHLCRLFYPVSTSQAGIPS